MAFITKSSQVVRHIVAALTSKNDMVSVKIVSSFTALALPTVSMKHKVSQLFVFGVEQNNPAALS